MLLRCGRACRVSACAVLETIRSCIDGRAVVKASPLERACHAVRAKLEIAPDKASSQTVDPMSPCIYEEQQLSTADFPGVTASGDLRILSETTDFVWTVFRDRESGGR